MPISKVDYRPWWEPWWRALIINVLGCFICLHVLEQRVRISGAWMTGVSLSVWILEKGYCLVPFYSKTDYLKMLSGGPWIIMGHYFTVMKWQPNFCPSKD